MLLKERILNIGSKKRLTNFMLNYKSFSDDELEEWYYGLNADINFGTNTQYDRKMLNFVEDELKNRNIKIKSR